MLPPLHTLFYFMEDLFEIGIKKYYYKNTKVKNYGYCKQCEEEFKKRELVKIIYCDTGLGLNWFGPHIVGLFHENCIDDFKKNEGGKNG